MTIRSHATLQELTQTSWDANERFEYWFPRPVADPTTDKPLVVLGGGREAAAPQFEIYVEDDSMVNGTVSRVLKDFLPSVFPGKYKRGQEPQMEWVSCSVSCVTKLTLLL
jgi:hypothetical protein